MLSQVGWILTTLGLVVGLHEPTLSICALLSAKSGTEAEAIALLEALLLGSGGGDVLNCGPAVLLGAARLDAASPLWSGAVSDSCLAATEAAAEALGPGELPCSWCTLCQQELAARAGALDKGEFLERAASLALTAAGGVDPSPTKNLVFWLEQVTVRTPSSIQGRSPVVPQWRCRLLFTASSAEGGSSEGGPLHFAAAAAAAAAAAILLHELCSVAASGTPSRLWRRQRRPWPGRGSRRTPGWPSSVPASAHPTSTPRRTPSRSTARS